MICLPHKKSMEVVDSHPGSQYGRAGARVFRAVDRRAREAGRERRGDLPEIGKA